MVIRTSSHSTGFPSISGCHLLEKVPGTEFGCHGVTLREVNLRHPLYVRDGHAHKKISHPSKKNWWYLFLMQLYMKSIIILNILILQKQVQTSPVDHSNNSEMEARIILSIISFWNTLFKNIELNISSNISKMSNY